MIEGSTVKGSLHSRISIAAFTLCSVAVACATAQALLMSPVLRQTISPTLYSSTGAVQMFGFAAWILGLALGGISVVWERRLKEGNTGQKSLLVAMLYVLVSFFIPAY